MRACKRHPHTAPGSKQRQLTPISITHCSCVHADMMEELAAAGLTVACRPPRFVHDLSSLMWGLKSQATNTKARLPRWLACGCCAGDRSTPGRGHSRVTCPQVTTVCLLACAACFAWYCSLTGLTAPLCGTDCALGSPQKAAPQHRQLACHTEPVTEPDSSQCCHVNARGATTGDAKEAAQQQIHPRFCGRCVGSKGPDWADMGRRTR